jgi:hypothetical protein
MFIFIIGLLFQSFAFSSSFVGYIWWDSQTSSAFYYVLMHLPFFNFGKVYLDVSLSTTGKYDVLTDTTIEGEGFAFSDLYVKLANDRLPSYGAEGRKPDVPTSSTSMCLMLMNIAIYFFLAWYLEHVIPDEYGRKEAPWFFLTKQFWGIEKEDAAALKSFVEKCKPLGSKPEFQVSEEDSNVKDERNKVFSSGKGYNGCAFECLYCALRPFPKYQSLIWRSTCIYIYI